MFRRLLVLLSVLALAVAGSAPVAADPPSPDDLKTSRFVVEFAERADLDTPRRIADRTERGRAVVDALRATAAASHVDARRILDAAGATYEDFWMRNVMVVDADAETIAELAALPNVTSIRAERSYEMLQPVETSEAVLAANGDPEWGVAKIGADAVWAQGITGAGVVVGSLDSGVQFDHPALVDSYRGNNGDGTFDHNYNWFDAAEACPTDEPCDDFGHGTHTMGTIVGGDGPGPFTPDIGVAPDATWMLVSCGPFFCTESQLMAAGEFFLAPTDLNGENPDVTKRPHVINNSWGGGPGDPFFLDMVAAWRAAGMIPVFASGNPGPSCGAGGSPGDYLDAFSVGATDINDVIADFSGRGPSAFGKVNPDVSAPGVDVVSSFPGDAYGAASGTSMATPHTVGTLALVMSSDISLIGDVDAATDIVRQTAMDIIDLSCGGDADGDPNNVYGEGRIDAAAAVAVAATGGTLTGTVTAASTGDPIAGARVSVTGGPFDASTSTASDGTYKMFLAEGTYTVSAGAFAYLDGTVAGVDVIVDQTTTQDFALDLAPSGVISGLVLTAENGHPVADATVTALGTPVDPVSSDADGAYELTLPFGTYSLQARLGGCMIPQTVEVTVDGDVTADFALATKIDSFGHGCSPTDFDWVDGTRPIGFGRFGDDVLRTKELPFKFPFYGKNWRTMYVGSNGHLSFLNPEFSPFFNSPIPNADIPNAAIYPLWQDLVIDGEASVWWTVQHTDTDRAIVVEYRNVVVFGGTARATFEVKMWESGSIDLLYADTDGVRSGAQATVGIENQLGTDALQLGYLEPVAESGTAWRISQVPIGRIFGTVTNANDGLPVEGATITADPGGRKATTASDGSYVLTLVPGTYSITASGEDYVSETVGLTVPRGRTTLDFVLDAASAEVDTTSLGATVDFGATQTFEVTVSNTGTAAMTWELFEQQLSATPPELDPAELAAFAAGKVYEPRAVPEGKGGVLSGYTFDGPLITVIDDPSGDSLSDVDVTTVRAGVDDDEVGIAVDYSSSTPIGSALGIVTLDTDQDPTTGLPADAIGGLPTQDVGVDYFVEMFNIHNPTNPTVAVWSADFEFVGEAPAEVSGQTISFAIPLEFFGPGEDGNIDIALNTGAVGPEDWAPDAGHGTITPFGDVPWIDASPAAGELEPGESTVVEVTLGSADTLPGSYEGLLALLANDPRNPRQDIAVSLDVTLPDEWGTVTGVVADSITGAPIAGASVSVAGEWDGAPFDMTATTDEAGAFDLVGPSGTWPATVSADGYLPHAGDLTVVAGVETAFDVALTPDVALIAVSPDALSFEVASGDTADALLTVGNDGTQPLEWEIVENLLEADTEAAAPPPASTPWTIGKRGWGPLDLPDGYKAAPLDVGFTQTNVIISDPEGDAAGPVDITTVEAGVDGATVSMRINLTESSPTEETVGFIYYDTDQDSSTGLPAEELNGLATQDIGMEFFMDLFLVPEVGIGLLVDAELFEVVAEIPVSFEGSTMVIDIPVEVFGPDEDGTINTAMVLGDFFEPTDWAPDEGFGEIAPFEDIPWLSLSETAGVLDPAGETDVVVTIDATGLAPGVYTGELMVRSNDQITGTVTVPVTLTVS